MIYDDRYKVIDIFGKKIHIFDDVFEFAERTRFYQFITNSRFSIGEYDGVLLENHKTSTLTSKYSEGDVGAMGFYLPKRVTDIVDLSDWKPVTAYTNLCRPDDSFHIHTDHHGPMWTVLYYVNTNWHIEWGGDTYFLREDDLTIEYVSQFRPGRVVIFDGSIPHLMRPSTRLAPENRFSFVMKYIPK